LEASHFLPIHSFVSYQTCKHEHDNVKENELSSIQIGTSDPHGKDKKRSTLGVRRSNVKVIGDQRKTGTPGIILDLFELSSFSSSKHNYIYEKIKDRHTTDESEF